MQLELLPEAKAVESTEPELQSIAAEVLREYEPGLDITDSTTAGKVHEIWTEIISRAELVEHRLAPQIAEARRKKQESQARANKQKWHAEVERLENISQFASSICYLTFEAAYEKLSERLIQFATERGIEPDDFCERANTVFSDPYYIEQTHKMTLLEVMEEVAKEFQE